MRTSQPRLMPGEINEALLLLRELRKFSNNLTLAAKLGFATATVYYWSEKRPPCREGLYALRRLSSQLLPTETVKRVLEAAQRSNYYYGRQL